MKNKTIILAGGTGFIGQALAARWGKDNRIIILSRQRPRERGRNRREHNRCMREHNRHPREHNNGYGHRLLSAGDGYDINYRYWDGRQVADWAEVLDGCDLVVNLAGRSVNCRYNARNMRDIFDSRTDATEAIGEAIRRTVTNAFFMKTLRRLMGARIGLPAPAWLLKVGAWIIGTETELLLKSRWVVPTKLLETGFGILRWNRR